MKKGRGKKKKITKKTKFSDLLNRYPEAAEVLFDKGFHCLGCAMAPFETLEQGALVHGLSKGEVDDLVNELNRVVFKQSSSGQVRAKKGLPKGRKKEKLKEK